MKNKEINLTVDKESLLLPFLIEKLVDYKRTKIKSFLIHKQITVSGKTVTKHDFKLMQGMKVLINKDKIIPEEELHGVKIIYEDKYIIVVDKPEGLLSVQTSEESNKMTLFGIVRDYLQSKDNKNKLFIVHRLDRETSGLIMFAKKDDVQKKLRDNWRDTVDERSYSAVVEGVVKKESGAIVSNLKENKNFVVYSSSDEKEKSKKAETLYKVIKHSDKYSLLDIKLETGRKNQIRVHMKDIGHCVAGDIKYGAKTDPVKRLCLHARVLAFTHPVTGEKLRFESNAPDIFNKLIKYI